MEMTLFEILNAAKGPAAIASFGLAGLLIVIALWKRFLRVPRHKQTPYRIE